jgi:hypothetical protein
MNPIGGTMIARIKQYVRDVYYVKKTYRQIKRRNANH